MSLYFPFKKPPPPTSRVAKGGWSSGCGWFRSTCNHFHNRLQAVAEVVSGGY